ncbi:SGNH/GDSL hydrolase family protein [Spongiibacter sp.]|uniref:SGNH/GDSL hydrolase family protein n=1 Tax=Spongiibacter sp. TaxID=2024860 RepID=UPI0035642F8F
MIYQLATLLLAPVFYVQGRYVKRVTPVLAEPAGARAGQVGCGPELSLLIVGDSAAAGVGVEHQYAALSGQVLGPLSSTRAVSWQLMAKSGDASAQLLASLRQSPARHFDAVLVSIGVNDVTGLTREARWASNLQAIIDTLQSRFGARVIYFSGLPPMQYFPALPQPLRWWLGWRAQRLNIRLQAVVGGYEGCEYVELAALLDGGDIAADGFHPGGEAYRRWGEQVAARIQADGVIALAPEGADNP